MKVLSTSFEKTCKYQTLLVLINNWRTLVSVWVSYAHLNLIYRLPKLLISVDGINKALNHVLRAPQKTVLRKGEVRYYIHVSLIYHYQLVINLNSWVKKSYLVFQTMIFSIYMNFLKSIKIPCTDVLSKTRATLLAECSFIINITKIDHKFGAPAAGRFDTFFSLWVILWSQYLIFYSLNIKL